MHWGIAFGSDLLTNRILGMTDQSIVKMGNKQLSTPSLLVDDFHSLEIPTLIEDMRDTMKAKKGVGIAAPQIGCNKRIIMFGFEKNERYPNEQPVPFTILINPSYKVLSEENIESWEGCLSIPGLRGLVPRAYKITYSGYDLQGNKITRTAEGFHARVVQHECDHLDGILFPQRIKDMRNFGFEDTLNF